LSIELVMSDNSLMIFHIFQLFVVTKSRWIKPCNANACGRCPTWDVIAKYLAATSLAAEAAVEKVASLKMKIHKTIYITISQLKFLIILTTHTILDR